MLSIFKNGYDNKYFPYMKEISEEHHLPPHGTTYSTTLILQVSDRYFDGKEIRFYRWQAFIKKAEDYRAKFYWVPFCGYETGYYLPNDKCGLLSQMASHLQKDTPRYDNVRKACLACLDRKGETRGDTSRPGSQHYSSAPGYDIIDGDLQTRIENEKINEKKEAYKSVQSIMHEAKKDTTEYGPNGWDCSESKTQKYLEDLRKLLPRTVSQSNINYNTYKQVIDDACKKYMI